MEKSQSQLYDKLLLLLSASNSAQRKNWDLDEAGRGPTQRTLAIERMKAMSGDMRDLPENYTRHPNVRVKNCWYWKISIAFVRKIPSTFCACTEQLKPLIWVYVETWCLCPVTCKYIYSMYFNEMNIFRILNFQRTLELIQS